MGVFVICGLGAKRHVKSQINTMKEEDSSSSTDEEETEDEDLTGRHLAHRDNPNVDVRKTLTSLHKKVKRQWKTLGHRLPNHSCCENCDGKFLTIRESASLSTTGKRRLDDAPMLCASKDCSNWTHFACRYGIMRDNTMRSGLPMHKDVNYKHFCRECEKKVPSLFRIKEDDPLNYCDICLMCIPATQHIVHHRNNHTKSKKKEGGQERTFPHGSLWVYRSGFTEYKEKQSCACIVCHKFHFLDRDGEKVSVRKCDGTCGRYGHKKCILESSTRGQVAVNETGEWTWLCSLCADKQTESRIRLEQLLTTQQSSAPMSDPQSLAARVTKRPRSIVSGPAEVPQTFLGGQEQDEVSGQEQVMTPRTPLVPLVSTRARTSRKTPPIVPATVTPPPPAQAHVSHVSPRQLCPHDKLMGICKSCGVFPGARGDEIVSVDLRNAIERVWAGRKLKMYMCTYASGKTAELTLDWITYEMSQKDDVEKAREMDDPEQHVVRQWDVVVVDGVPLIKVCYEESDGILVTNNFFAKEVRESVLSRAFTVSKEQIEQLRNEWQKVQQYHKDTEANARREISSLKQKYDTTLARLREEFETKKEIEKKEFDRSLSQVKEQYRHILKGMQHLRVSSPYVRDIISGI